MKKINVKNISICIGIMLLSVSLNAQKFTPIDKSPMDAASFPSSYKVSDKTVKVTYGRPQLKGRSLSELIPNGKQWRTGANEAVEITFYKNMQVAGTEIQAGTYTLSTIPGEREWTLIFSSDLNVWGSYFYNKDNDVARIIVETSQAKDVLEAFSIAFDDEGNMFLGWDTLRVKIPMTE
ncbi:DUF2911 domain-containing protein [Flavobacteriaceae bacterium]|jgi:hypothetical protein|nr:DUF2911 domain-containing protein [Flavobacteriaceae bacterium]